MPFVKLDCKIIYSSIWFENPETKVVWITMLAMADMSGLVPATAPGIANTAGVPLDDTRKAIVILESSDPDSKNPKNDGRRIERVNGGYKILNYESYRSFNYSMNEFAIEKRKYREKIKNEKKDISPDNVRTMSGHSASASGNCISFKDKEEEIKNNAVLILNHLNHKAGRKFSDTKQIVKMLKAGKPVDQFLQIIDTKLFDPFFTENPQYFNPTTLFRESHWDTYINQKREDFKHREQKIDYRTVGTADEFAADKADIERRKARALTEKNRGETNG
jgi:uncharacterized phage protein (TIGR02220 family)